MIKRKIMEKKVLFVLAFAMLFIGMTVSSCSSDEDPRIIVYPGQIIRSMVTISEMQKVRLQQFIMKTGCPIGLY
jgi:hypothetical protein